MRDQQSAAAPEVRSSGAISSSSASECSKAGGHGRHEPVSISATTEPDDLARPSVIRVRPPNLSPSVNFSKLRPHGYHRYPQCIILDSRKLRIFLGAR